MLYVQVWAFGLKFMLGCTHKFLTKRENKLKGGIYYANKNQTRRAQTARKLIPLRNYVTVLYKRDEFERMGGRG